MPVPMGNLEFQVGPVIWGSTGVFTKYFGIKQLHVPPEKWPTGQIQDSVISRLI